MVDFTDFNMTGFNAEDHASTGMIYNPLGDYLVEITDMETKVSNAGNNMLAIKVEFMDGDLVGSEHQFTLNLQHPTPKVVEIALQELAKISTATGIDVGSVGLMGLLKGKMRMIFVNDPKNTYQDANGETRTGTKIAKFKAADAVKTETPAPTVGASAPAPAVSQAPAPVVDEDEIPW